MKATVLVCFLLGLCAAAPVNDRRQDTSDATFLTVSADNVVARDYPKPTTTTQTHPHHTSHQSHHGSHHPTGGYYPKAPHSTGGSYPRGHPGAPFPTEYHHPHSHYPHPSNSYPHPSYNPTGGVFPRAANPFPTAPPQGEPEPGTRTRPDNFPHPTFPSHSGRPIQPTSIGHPPGPGHFPF
ncbi:hypothetical protein F5Y16DRAFT_126781 [Xylariaceae sp. FL0255]|nr:hypothetical protein F5Y16DRAFT_126781 [Xylariaceae sp. FL0255]